MITQVIFLCLFIKRQKGKTLFKLIMKKSQSYLISTITSNSLSDMLHVIHDELQCSSLTFNYLVLVLKTRPVACCWQFIEVISWVSYQFGHVDRMYWKGSTGDDHDNKPRSLFVTQQIESCLGLKYPWLSKGQVWGHVMIPWYLNTESWLTTMKSSWQTSYHWNTLMGPHWPPDLSVKGQPAHDEVCL